MPTLRIICFGLPRAEIDGHGALRFQTEKFLELLIIAALATDAQLIRSAAAAALRIDQSEAQARRALSTDLWRLRKAFSDHGLDSTDYLDTSSRGIGLCEGDVAQASMPIKQGSNFPRKPGTPPRRIFF